ncbi:hypothetical protein AB0B45_34915 [Nonomuraea sp. NPDC049152]|uniref:hypothetical protein n=1 Tax=Nonomuraea sp. NPDC049152 TaxID=3154350 RepID=UPI0033F5D5BA
MAEHRDAVGDTGFCFFGKKVVLPAGTIIRVGPQEKKVYLEPVIDARLGMSGVRELEIRTGPAGARRPARHATSVLVCPPAQRTAPASSARPKKPENTWPTVRPCPASP